MSCIMYKVGIREILTSSGKIIEYWPGMMMLVPD